ncbi:hypothetical protein WR25_19407 [Diploscapter pachys]|uniref:F-box domain-containing protein n=1 Tax=Diploscapter pachys TaxID=2018661 RepID=A0A2A2K9A5_9BILA|nr:hypothetical protein WR25_19407 [Diploscapter pachys]
MQRCSDCSDPIHPPYSSPFFPLRIPFVLANIDPPLLSNFVAKMISVTVAANNGNKCTHRRVVGSHLKAYGAGRLSICELNKESTSSEKPHIPAKTRWHRVFTKLVTIFTAAFKLLFPFLFWNKANTEFNLRQIIRLKRSTSIRRSPIKKLSENLLEKVFARLDDPSDILSCGKVCKKWRKAIESAGDRLTKFNIDQLRILFDEGEVMIYPVDQLKGPVRHQLPSLQGLSRCLRHLHTSSLFIRGLLPIESDLVLRSLNGISLMPQQVFFVWCQFSQESMTLLSEFLQLNKPTLNDLGFEDCSLTQLISDELVLPILSNLKSLRVWSDGRSGEYGISDVTIYGLIDCMNDGRAVESIDMAACSITHHSVFHLIITWMDHAYSDLYITLNHNPKFDRYKFHLIES